MRTEDHPLEYLEWEGVIPEGEYGAGPMIVWDRGVFQNISETRRGEPMELADAIEKGDVKIFMLGEKIKGAYALVRTGPPSDREKWLLIKKRDEGADARRRADLLPARVRAQRPDHRAGARRGGRARPVPAPPRPAPSAPALVCIPWPPRPRQGRCRTTSRAGGATPRPSEALEDRDPGDG